MTHRGSTMTHRGSTLTHKDSPLCLYSPQNSAVLNVGHKQGCLRGHSGCQHLRRISNSIKQPARKQRGQHA